VSFCTKPVSKGRVAAAVEQAFAPTGSPKEEAIVDSIRARIACLRRASGVMAMVTGGPVEQAIAGD